MNFTNFVAEKAMNSKTYLDVQSRLGETALVGFEFEMAFDESSAFYDPDTDREKISLSSLTTVEDYVQYFDISVRLKNDIKGDYELYLEDKVPDEVDARWREYDDDEKIGREEAYQDLERKMHTIHTFEDWIRDEFGSALKFAIAYDLEPDYGWADESDRYAAVWADSGDDTIAGTIDNVRTSLDRIVDKPVIASYKYHEKKKTKSNWYVEPDSSIAGGHGIEVVSPPETMNAAINSMKTVFKWMRSTGAATNSSTGLHINVSIPNMAERIDLVKLLMFMGEDYALKLFSRTGNEYALPQAELIMRKVKDNGRLPTGSASEMIEAAKSALGTGKHRSVNIGHLSDGYLEFRVAGGVGYQEDDDKVKQAVQRFVTAVEIACDPMLERQEYLKKLAKVFDKAKDHVEKGTFSEDEPVVPKELRRLQKYSRYVARYYSNFQSLTYKDEQRSALLALLNTCIKAAHDYNSSIDLKERVYFKTLIKRCNLQSSDVDVYYGHNQMDRLRFKKEIGL